MGRGGGGGGRRGRAGRNRRGRHRGGGGGGAVMFRAPNTGNPALDRRINIARCASFLAFIVILSGVYVFTSRSMIWGIVMITGGGLVFLSTAFSIMHMRKTTIVNLQPQQGTRTGGLRTVTTAPPTVGYPTPCSESAGAPAGLPQYGFTPGFTYGAQYSPYPGSATAGIEELAPGYPVGPPQSYPGVPSQDYSMLPPPQYPQVPPTPPAYPPPPSYEDTMNPKN